jgi:hypothetical protein
MEEILAVAFLAVASASLAVHVSTLALITRDGAGTRMPGTHKRLRGTLRVRVFGAALYSAIGLVALVATPITAPAALVVFVILTTLYAVNSLRDWHYWQAQRALDRGGVQRGPGAERRTIYGRHAHADRSPARRLVPDPARAPTRGRIDPDTGRWTVTNRDSRTGWPPAPLH